MENEPRPEHLESFIIHKFGQKDRNEVRKIQRAWAQIHRESRELIKRGGIDGRSYRQWVIERVQEIKLPYFVEMPFDHPEPVITHVPIEENMRLQEIIRKMEEERLELQSSNSRISLKAENLEANLKEVKEELAGR